MPTTNPEPRYHISEEDLDGIRRSMREGYEDLKRSVTEIMRDARRESYAPSPPPHRAMDGESDPEMDRRRYGF